MSQGLITENCQFIKEDGNQCQGFPMNGTKYCYLHNPDISEKEKKEIQAKGGRNTKIRVLDPLAPISLQEPENILELLGDTINRVRDGSMDTNIANCIGYLSGQALKAFEISELKRKVELLESFFSKKS